MPAPKSLSSAQKATITGPCTPYCCSTLASRALCFLSCAAPACNRFCEISLAENAVKLWAKKLCRRSRAMTPGSSVMPSSTAEMVGREMPPVAAALRKPASQVSKLPVLRQLLLGGGYFVGSASADTAPLHASTSVNTANFALDCRIATACQSLQGLLIEPRVRPSSVPPLRGPTALLQCCEPEERLPPSNSGVAIAAPPAWPSGWRRAKLERTRQRALARRVAGDRLAVRHMRPDESVGLRLLVALVDLQNRVVDRGACHRADQQGDRAAVTGCEHIAGRCPRLAAACDWVSDVEGARPATRWRSGTSSSAALSGAPVSVQLARR